MDFKFGNECLSVRVHLTPGRDAQLARCMKVEKVDCVVHDVAIGLHTSRLDFLDKVSSPIIMSRVKKLIQGAVKESVADMLVSLDTDIADSVAVSAATANKPIPASSAVTP
ncbi:hypothetical protein BDK51DRAFT_27120 [Blyttiomyces helicus]|uniref:Uncharacterized protein n=1 Tax=Blyttiomyces helicus TaxID=388810 RepID=A0A4P9W4V9_9FUNG|nr:hypothetical protein BDK51DRAFT_27120 [Blyttiomyces helicus]|eukprot:RKO87254.1 hypothetical protein BDK51DRAFT_27120 [Blyttiomyces helicus]